MRFRRGVILFLASHHSAAQILSTLRANRKTTPGHTPPTTNRHAAYDALEESIISVAGLLEALALLLQASLTNEGVALSREAAAGLQALASQQAALLRRRFGQVCDREADSI